MAILFVCDSGLYSNNYPEEKNFPNSVSREFSFDIKIAVYYYNPDIKNHEIISASVRIIGEKPYQINDSLYAEINTITLKDGFKKYQIEISKPGFEVYSEDFSSENIKLFIFNPLIVVLKKKNSGMGFEKIPVKEITKTEKTLKPNNKIKALDNELIAYYPFDGNPNDSSKNKFDGNDYGPAGYIEGKFSEARYFSNNQNKDAVADDFSILPNVIGNEDFTVNFWAKFDYSSSHQFIFYLSPGQDWTRASFCLSLSPDMKLSAIINGLDLRTIDYSHYQLLNGQYHNSYLNSISLELNKFYNISCVFKNSVFTIYVDGKVYARYKNVYKKIGKPDAMLLVGACPKPGSLYYPYTGQLDELRFYKRALSEAEINLFTVNK